MTLLVDLVAASRKLSDTSSRTAKVAILADILGRLDASETGMAVAFLTGAPRQGRAPLRRTEAPGSARTSPRPRCCRARRARASPPRALGRALRADQPGSGRRRTSRPRHRRSPGARARGPRAGTRRARRAPDYDPAAPARGRVRLRYRRRRP